MKTPPHNETGYRLRVFRKGLNLTQAELAKEIGQSTKTVNLTENGRRFPNNEYIKSLIEKFNIDVHWLFTGEKLTEKLGRQYRDRLSNLEINYARIEGMLKTSKMK